MTPRVSLRGTWRIIETELWDPHDLDDVTEAHLTLGNSNLGELAFLCVSADVDYRVVQRDSQPAVEFSFNGEDEFTPISGRGWAILNGDELHGRLFFHCGDESASWQSESGPSGGPPSNKALQLTGPQRAPIDVW